MWYADVACLLWRNHDVERESSTIEMAAFGTRQCVCAVATQKLVFTSLEFF